MWTAYPSVDYLLTQHFAPNSFKEKVPEIGRNSSSYSVFEET